MKHVEEDGDLHQVDPPADVVVPQHDQVPTQLQAGLLYEVRLPVALEDLEQRAGVDIRGVLRDQLGQDYAAVSLQKIFRTHRSCC